MPTSTREITNSEDIIDSRDVIARIESLKADRPDTLSSPPQDGQEWGEWTEDEEDELNALLALEDEASSSPDWTYGETLIRDSYFEEYAQELAEDIGAIQRDASWPNNYIDWEAAADALKQDYMSVDFDGVTYWVRA